MNVREWFGTEEVCLAKLDIDKSLEDLLCTYREALQFYFGLKDTPSILDLVEQVKDRDLSYSDRLFVEWLKEKGLPYLRQLSGKTLPNDESIKAQLEYEKYILEQELSYGITEDLRSNLIDIVDELPNQLNQASSSEDKYKIEIFYSNVKENGYSIPKIEGVPQMDSFNFLQEVEDDGIRTI